MTDSGEATYREGDSPVWGSEAERILGLTERQLRKFSSTPDADLARIRSDAGRVFSRSVSARGSAEVESQLVVGRVQAGKTSNFIVVSGLARDNGYQLFIVLAGTKSELLDQTLRRLKKTLAAASPVALPAFWVHRLSIGEEDALAAELRSKLAALRNPATATGQAPVLVVLKQDDNLLSLQTVLANLHALMPLDTIPTMFIDDEADQASPDTRVRRAGPATSVVHASIAGVRELLPWHTFLAYTATPQANLLMELKGLLHPRFVSVIDSGGDYVGVQELFGVGLTGYASEVLDTPPLAHRPPESLRDALANFLCQMVLVRHYREDVLLEPLRSSDELVCVTMLLNPASGIADHDVWRELADTVLDAWSRQLSDPRDLAAQRLIAEFIQPAWTSLRLSLQATGMGSSVPEQPSDADVARLAELIPYVERRTINSVTAKTGVRLPEDEEWNQQIAWLFIGGDILGRGQTLINLMTTYMPRTGGMGAIDTIQQRGRFYGYHAAYRPLLRGWFEPDTLGLYRSAAGSEAALLASLSDLDRSGSPLSDWTRALLLGTGGLHATRKAVIPLSARELTQREWAFSQSYILDHSVNEANQGVLSDFLAEHGPGLLMWLNETRADPQNFRVEVPMSNFLGLLNDWSATGPEIQALTDLSLTLGRIDEQSEGATVSVVVMDRDPSATTDLERTSYRSLQGSRSGSGSRDRIGNPVGQQQRQVVDDQRITAQLHMFRVGDTANPVPGTIFLADHAPSLVVHLPETFRHRVMIFDPTV